MYVCTSVLAIKQSNFGYYVSCKLELLCQAVSATSHIKTARCIAPHFADRLLDVWLLSTIRDAEMETGRDANSARRLSCFDDCSLTVSLIEGAILRHG